MQQRESDPFQAPIWPFLRGGASLSSLRVYVEGGSSCPTEDRMTRGQPPEWMKVHTRGFGEWFEPRFEITQKKSQGSLKTGKGRTGFEAAGKRKTTTRTSALNFHTLQAAGDSIRRADKPSSHLEPCQP